MSLKEIEIQEIIAIRRRSTAILVRQFFHGVISEFEYVMKMATLHNIKQMRAQSARLLIDALTYATLKA